jgi:cold shock CspA family protein
MTGTITKIDLEKGFGFITPRRGRSVFFFKDRLDTLDFDSTLLNRRVIFQLVILPRGTNARAIRPIPRRRTN